MCAREPYNAAQDVFSTILAASDADRAAVAAEEFAAAFGARKSRGPEADSARGARITSTVYRSGGRPILATNQSGVRSVAISPRSTARFQSVVRMSRSSGFSRTPR